MHFSNIAIVLGPLIGLSAARPPHYPSPSGSITPLPSFSPFPSVSPPPLPSVTLPPPGESGLPGGPFEKREEDFQLHHHRPHPSGRPYPSGRPHPSGRPQPSSSGLPPPSGRPQPSSSGLPPPSGRPQPSSSGLTPPPVGSVFPGGPFEKRDTEFHHHRPHPSSRPHPSGTPLPSVVPSGFPRPKPSGKITV